MTLELELAIRKEGNEIIIETAGNPKEFAKGDPSYSWYFDPLEKGEVWTNPYDWYGDTLNISYNGYEI